MPSLAPSLASRNSKTGALKNIFICAYLFVLQSIPPNLSCIQALPLVEGSIILLSSLQMPAIRF